MTYEDLLKSSNWVQNISSSYFESLGATVLIFKLDKDNTKLNPIYNEEINGRHYLRPFEIKSIYKTDPFSFSFDNTIPSETEGSLNFYFNFNNMVKTINSLKKSTSELLIKANQPNWKISKSGDFVYLVNPNILDDPISIDLNEYSTISSLCNRISYYPNGDIETSFFETKCSGDDYSKCIPNFKETKLANSILLKTFNSEFKNVSDTIEQGDLIYITTTNALYEVTSAYPVNNTIYRYVNWQCNAQRTFSYVEYEKLKTYQYGFNLTDTITSTPAATDVSIKVEGTTEYDIATDAQIQEIINQTWGNN